MRRQQLLHCNFYLPAATQIRDMNTFQRLEKIRRPAVDGKEAKGGSPTPFFTLREGGQQDLQAIYN